MNFFEDHIQEILQQNLVKCLNDIMTIIEKKKILKTIIDKNIFPTDKICREVTKESNQPPMTNMPLTQN
mgnify:CR=1 FL=1